MGNDEKQQKRRRKPARKQRTATGTEPKTGEQESNRRVHMLRVGRTDRHFLNTVAVFLRTAVLLSEKQRCRKCASSKKKKSMHRKDGLGCKFRGMGQIRVREQLTRKTQVTRVPPMTERQRGYLPKTPTKQFAWSIASHEHGNLLTSIQNTFFTCPT